MSIIKILSFNVNGIRSLEKHIKSTNKKYDINQWLIDLGYDIYCFQEVKGSRDNLEKYFTLNDFCAFASFHKQPGRHGVMTFVSKKSNCYEVTEVEKGRILKTTHNGFSLYNCYMPYCSEDDATDVIMSVYEKLSNSLKKDKEECIFIAGDLNATYNMSDNYIYQQEYEKLVYVDNFEEKVKHRKELKSHTECNKHNHTSNSKENISQLIKVWDDIFYKKVRDLSENGIYTEKIKPKATEMEVYYLSVHELYKRFMEKKQRKWLFNMVKEYTDVYREVNTELFKYTCWDQQLSLRACNLGTRIDYILMKNRRNYNIIAAEIHQNIGGSDHCPVSVKIEIESKSLDKYKEKKNIVKKPHNLMDYIKNKKQ